MFKLGPVPDDHQQGGFPSKLLNQQEYYWKAVRHVVARSIMVVAISALVFPTAYSNMFFWLPAGAESDATLLESCVKEVLAAVIAAVPVIYCLPVSHGDWRLRQDAMVRLYGGGGGGRPDGEDQPAQEVVLAAMGVLSLAKAVQDEVFFRLLLCGLVGAVTGSPYFALGLSAFVYSRHSLDRFVEGLWYASIFLTGIVGIPGLILTHLLVNWHWDATCWKHVVTQLRYVDARTTTTTEPATIASAAASSSSSMSSSSSDLHRFFLAHDSRHCGRLNAHDMRRALEYASQGRQILHYLDDIEIDKEYDYDEFETKLRELHKEGVLY
jgi:hypothetical protein